MNRFFLSFFFSVFLFSQANGLFCEQSYAAQKKHPFPAKSCEQSWMNLDPSDYLFDYSKDVYKTERGNEGYKRFIKRLSDHNLLRSECHKAWTVLIFMAATPDLEKYAYADLLEMESGLKKSLQKTGSTLRTDIVAHFESTSRKEIRRLHMFQDPAIHLKRLRKNDLAALEINQIHSPLISISHSMNSQPIEDRFRKFLKWGVREFPSEHYLVIIWGHGQGWTASDSTSEHQEGGAIIEGSSDYLNIPTFRKVLSRVKNLNHEPIDVLAADSCFMQTVEDTTELNRHVRYICGSEDTESYAGFPYQSLIRQLNSGKFLMARKQLSLQKEKSGPLFPGARSSLDADEPFLLAWTLPQLYKKSFSPKGSQAKLDPSMSSHLTGSTVLTKNFRNSLLPALDNLGSALVRYVQESDSNWTKVKVAIEKGHIFQGGTQDLGAFLQRINQVLKEKEATEKSLSPIALQLKKSIEDTFVALNYSVLNTVLGTNYPKFDSGEEIGPKGISIWLPRTDEEFQDRAEDFFKSIFYSQCKGWYEWMNTIYLPAT